MSPDDKLYKALNAHMRSIGYYAVYDELMLLMWMEDTTEARLWMARAMEKKRCPRGIIRVGNRHYLTWNLDPGSKIFDKVAAKEAVARYLATSMLPAAERQFVYKTRAYAVFGSEVAR